MRMVIRKWGLCKWNGTHSVFSSSYSVGELMQNLVHGLRNFPTGTEYYCVYLILGRLISRPTSESLPESENKQILHMRVGRKR